MLLSVIVPIYNVAAYLPEFLDSLYSQRWTEREIILIDDGSTDGSREIMESYRARYPETQILTQKNSGISVARNRGMEVARGDYFAFPDADDVLDREMYAALMEAAQADDLDVATCNGRYLRNGQPAEPIFSSLQTSGVTRGLDWLATAIRSRELLHVVWLNVYKASYVRRHRFTFIPGLNHQDIPWTTEVLAFAERTRFLAAPMYYYRERGDSISRQKSIAQRKRIAQSYMTIIEELERFYEKHRDFLAPVESDLRWQIADEGLGIFHEIEHMPSAQDRLALFAEMKARQLDRLLLRNAQTGKQKWRTLKRVARMHLVLSGARVLRRSL